MVNIKFLIIILDEGYDKKVKSLLNRFGIKIKTVSNAHGTALPSILDYFGLVETKKEIFMAIIPDYLSNEILNKITDVFNLNHAGKGIAFTIPISSANKYLSDSFLNSNLERNSLNMEIQDKYHLILTIVSEGYLEQVMEAVRAAGGIGGTVIKGRGLNNNTTAKILGFNIEPEKDIVLNIVLEKDKTKIMEAITKEVGIKTKGRGVCISLPVADVVGMDALNK